MPDIILNFRNPLDELPADSHELLIIVKETPKHQRCMMLAHFSPSLNIFTHENGYFTRFEVESWIPSSEIVNA